MYVRYRRQVFKQWWGSHFQIVQFHDHPYTVPRDERFCLLLTIHLVQGSCAQYSPKYIIQTGFFFFLFFLCFTLKKRILDILHGISSILCYFLHLPYFFFYFELICELLLVAKWVSRDGMLMDLIGLKSTLFWNKESVCFNGTLHHRKSSAARFQSQSLSNSLYLKRAWLGNTNNFMPSQLYSVFWF